MKNIAARVATGKYLVFLNEDSCLDDVYLDSICTVFDSNSKIATVFGSVETVVSNKHQKFAKLFGAYQVDEDDILSYYAVDLPSPFSFAVRSSSFKVVGGFYHLSGETSGLSQLEHLGMAARLHKDKHFTYLSADATVVRYVESVNEKIAADLHEDYIYNRYWLELNHVLPAVSWQNAKVAQAGDLINKVLLDPINKKYWDMVKKDYAEKAKGDLNRDLFSQLV